MNIKNFRVSSIQFSFADIEMSSFSPLLPVLLLTVINGLRLDEQVVPFDLYYCYHLSNY